jgi:hypothetical protein
LFENLIHTQYLKLFGMAIALCWSFPIDDYPTSLTCPPQMRLVEPQGMRAPPVYRDGALSYATALMRCSGLKNQSFNLGFQKLIE